MKILASACGTVVHESGNKLYISKRPAQWTPVFLFVTALLAVIFLVNGIVQLANKVPGNERTIIGAILLGVALLLAIVCWRVALYQKKIGALPTDALAQILVVDLQNNNIYDAGQHLLCNLQQAWLERKMQLSSSSPELVLKWNHGSCSIVKGNPFAGSIVAVENALVTRGFRKIK